MPSVFNDPSIWFSIIAAVVSIKALLQTSKQMILSNKQHLFSERLNAYLISMGLMRLYDENMKYIEESINQVDTEYADIEFIFTAMTNNTYLEQLCSVIDHPEENPWHKEFLIKLEDMQNIATKIVFIFNNSKKLERFILSYKDVLYKMYIYHRSFKKIGEISQDSTFYNSEVTDCQDIEKQRRGELSKSFKTLKSAYDELKDDKTMETISTQIQLLE